MRFFSPDFENGGEIPEKFSCNGEGIRPTVIWEDVPLRAKSLAISVIDPDSPSGNYIHWQVVNIFPSVSEIDSSGGVPGDEIKNSSGEARFVPPCPGSGKHRYAFTLYALDIEKVEPVTLTNISDQLTENVIEKAEFFATYEKRG